MIKAHPNARAWDAPDAMETVPHVWNDGKARSTPRCLCDDGAILLSGPYRRLFVQAMDEARTAADSAGHVYNGDAHMCVNLRTEGGIAARWALDLNGAVVAGGFVYPIAIREERRAPEYRPGRPYEGAVSAPGARIKVAP